MRRTLLALLLVFPSAASAQIITGTAKAIDGDTLDFAGEHVRLHGIDALETRQTCNRGDEAWECGQEASRLLAELVTGKSVVCEQRDRDVYDRVVATCRVGQLDLGQVMIEAGLAVALPQFSTAYVDNEARARGLGIGIWGAQFDKPADYRAAHADQVRTPIRTKPGQQPSRPQVARPSGIYYGNCAQAWAAGAAPIYDGQPGYRPEMDGDGDGIACEPYRGRR